jgi:hypothetical protein
LGKEVVVAQGRGSVEAVAEVRASALGMASGGMALEGMVLEGMVLEGMVLEGMVLENMAADNYFRNVESRFLVESPRRRVQRDR